MMLCVFCVVWCYHIVVFHDGYDTTVLIQQFCVVFCVLYDVVWSVVLSCCCVS